MGLVDAVVRGEVKPTAREKDYKNYCEADSEPLHEGHFFWIKHLRSSLGLSQESLSVACATGPQFQGESSSHY